MMFSSKILCVISIIFSFHYNASSLYIDIFDKQPLIVGGLPVIFGSYPYQVSLQVNKTALGLEFDPHEGPWAHNCGGSIVTKDYIVTAAHCLDGYTAASLSVLTGTVNIAPHNNGVRYLIASTAIHPNYEELVSHDVGVMKVTTSIIFNAVTAPIAMNQIPVGPGVICVLTGWGYITPFRMGSTPTWLQEAFLSTLDNEDCRGRAFDVTETEICTYTRFLQGACGGDSGGPLVCNGVLSGIVSYGTSVCAIGYPDVYTRVTANSIYGWIMQQITS